jgi:hypothetical protein
MRRAFLGAVLSLGLLWASAAVGAEHRYFGHHPLPALQGFCYLDGSHVHGDAPDAKVVNLFRTQGGHYYFVGDPYFFGYTRPAFAYDAHHPIHPTFGGTWCFLDGPHYHFFHPHQDHVRYYIVFGGRYYYVGPVDPSYHALRPLLYIEPPPSVGAAVYAPAFATRNQYALYHGRPASLDYVVQGKLPRRHFVPGMYAGAAFGLPGFHAGASVGVPGVSAHLGVSVPAVGVGVGVGVAPPPPGVLVPGPPPPGAPPGWFRGKKKGWKKWKGWD